jgi:hypothetical protein
MRARKFDIIASGKENKARNSQWFHFGRYGKAGAVLGRAAAVAEQKGLVDLLDMDAALNRVCDLKDPAECSLAPE